MNGKGLGRMGSISWAKRGKGGKESTSIYLAQRLKKEMQEKKFGIDREHIFATSHRTGHEPLISVQRGKKRNPIKPASTLGDKRWRFV